MSCEERHCPFDTLKRWGTVPQRFNATEDTPPIRYDGNSLNHFFQTFSLFYVINSVDESQLLI